MSNTITLWQQVCYDLAKHPSDDSFISGSRKIIRGVQWSLSHIDDSINLTHMGYAPTGPKIKQLTRYYLNRESMDIAIADLLVRTNRSSYGSVGVTTHSHQKEGFTIQGFCIQSFTLTQLPKRRMEMDIFYRTTEIMKKFGADLIFFRDIIIPEFRDCFDKSPLIKINFHFANVSVHPMFFCLLAISDRHWLDELQSIRAVDPKFYLSILIWTMRNMDGYENQPFLTSRMVGKSMWNSLGPKKFNRLKRKVGRLIP